MGHQIRFYLSNEDSLKLKSELENVEPATFVYSRSRGPFPKPFVPSDEIENEQPRLFLYLIREIDLEMVKMNEVPTQGYWTINQLKSPAVEFTDCSVDGQTVKQGRLYYTSSYYDDEGNLVEKSLSFRNWAKEVFKSARKLLTYDRELEAYLGADVSRLHGKGLELRHF